MDALQWSDLVKNYITAIGIGLGGAWAFWKWGYTEWQESRKNRASLDGQISARAERLANGHLVVTVVGQWNNRGYFPIPIDTRQSRVLVYRLPDTLPPGPLDPDADFGRPLFEQYPFKNFASFELEPKTESFLRAHFVLELESKYFFRWRLYKLKEPDSNYEFFWSKELVWTAPSNTTVSTDARQDQPHAG